MDLTDYIWKHYPEIIKKIEQDLCHCQRGKEHINFPACIDIAMESTMARWDFKFYWNIVAKRLKKEYPELVMEYFLMYGEI